MTKPLSAIFLLLFASTSAASAGSVVVLAPQEPGPYSEAAQSLVATMAKDHPDHQVRMAGPDDPAPDADVVVALGASATKSANASGKPFVSGMAMSPADVPQGATGVALRYPIDRQLSLIRLLLPQATRIGLVYSSAEAGEFAARAQIQAASLGMELLSVRVESAKELQSALAGLANRIDVLWSVPDPTLYSPQTAKPILLFSFRHKIPFIGLSDTWVKAGALAAPSFDFEAIGAQCAGLAVQVLEGTPMSELAVQSPEGMPYSVNQNTASQLKVQLPAGVARNANHVW